MSDELVFNADAVTPRMLIDFKEKTGLSLFAIWEGDGIELDKAEPEVIAAVIWLALRMSGQPEATWEQAVDTPFSSLSMGEPAAPDPTNAS
jgi:hypothetical protein